MRREKGLVGMLLVLIAAAVTLSGVATRVDLLLFDVGQRLVQRSAPDDLVIVAIDEDSLGRIGRWPWPRDVHARFLTMLCASDPVAVGLDLAFSEQSADPAADRALAQAIAHCGKVVLPVVIETSRAGGQVVESPPIADLAASVAGLGRVGVRLDEDGIARSVDLREGVGAAAWPLFSEELLRVAGHAVIAPAAQEQPATDPILVSRDHRRIEYIGPPESFPRISYAQVLEGKLRAGLFAGKTVLVGVTAVGLGDFLPTPVSARAQPMPGVEVQANIWQSMHQQRLIEVAAVWASMLFCAVLALVPLLWLPQLMPLPGLLASALWFVALAGLCALSPRFLLFWFAPSGALFSALFAFPLWSWRRLEVARRHLDRELRELRAVLPGKGHVSDGPGSERRMGFEQRIAWVQAAQRRMVLLEKQRNDALAFISHDLRSPLASVVQRLEAQPVCESAQLLPSLRRASDMAQEFLRLARAEALDLHQMKEVDLVSVLQQAVDEVFHLARQRQLSIVCCFPDDPVWIAGNFAALERSAINLLQNALTYAPAATQIDVGLERQGEEVRFWVENEGAPFDARQAERLFQRYSRSDQEALNPAGTGLGLYYVRTVAEKHGGRAGVVCAGGKVRFWVSLPVLLNTTESASQV